MSKGILKEHWSKDKGRRTLFIVRFNKPIASYMVGEIKDRIHILPFLDTYFNKQEAYIGFGWLLIEFEFWHRIYYK